MKNKFSIITTLLLLTLVLPAQAKIVSQEINDGWRFKQARQGSWHEAKVPGEVHTDLIRNGMIEDPFFGQNERGVQWVDKEDWIYETVFTPSSDLLKENNVDLVFKGLDTYADVYLNDSLILKANNMFRQWQVPVKGLLKDGQNTLRVYLHSPIKVDLPKFDALDFRYEAGNDQSENGGLFDKKVSVFARKAGYHYGWDWGPRLVTSGIWRPILLEGWSDNKIENLFIQTKNIAKKKAQMEASFDIISEKAQKGTVQIVDLSSGKTSGKGSESSKGRGKDKVLKSQPITLSEGNNNFTLSFDINNPRLWWTNGLGEPELYDLECRLIIDGKEVAQEQVTTGVRTIEVVREKDPDENGTSFYFKLNGTPVFAKGANYIPCDNFLSRVTKDVYDRTIKDAVDVNMNMLRIWGGGIYEDDYFYELCDKNGILIWQDFMFACSLYPAEGELLENIRQEAIDNVVRLRNHPCIALWCGNNECLEGWYCWGWQRNYKEQGVDSIIWKQYNDLYHKTLSEVVTAYAPSTFYWPSSPFSRYEGRPEPNNGDYHLWTVWGGGKPFDEFNQVHSRFFSEYGFQSFPTLETVKTYAPDEKDWDINSDVMMAHQRGGMNANNKINDYLSVYYPTPKDFESLLYMTQLQQGDAIRTAIEAHRRDKPYCMGSLYWQHNDCWPVASWSSRDYYGNWKAQHYFARRLFDDILVSNYIEENVGDDNESDALMVSVISDRTKPVKGSLKVRFLTLDGNVVNEFEEDYNLEADGVETTGFNIDNIIGENDKSNIVVLSEYKTTDTNTNASKTYSCISLLVKDKDLNYQSPNIEWTLSETEDGKYLDLSADTFVRGLFITLPGLECKYSDNFFDIIPGRNVKVEMDTDADLQSIRDNIKLLDLYSATHK